MPSFKLDVKNNYLHLLEACIQSKSVAEAKKIHQHFLKNASNTNDSSVLHKLTHLYLSCNQVASARRLFDEIPKPSVTLWNQFIRAYAWNGHFEVAIDLYYRMLRLGVKPNKYTYPFVLKACSGLLAVEDGVEIHSQARCSGFESDVFVCTALVDFYAKCGSLEEAQKLFNRMSRRDVVAWNAMIAGCSLHGLCDDAIRLIMQMQEEGIFPNSSTIVGVLPTVGESKALGHGKALHGYCVRRSFDNGVVVGTGLLNMYAKCECLSYAKLIFDAMGIKNEISWSAMIGGYVSSDCMREALELFDQMILMDAVDPTPVTLGSVLRSCAKLTDLSRGRKLHCYIVKSGSVLDILLGNTLVSMYAKCGVIDDATRFFEEMNPKDTVSFSAVIAGCVQNGSAEEALGIFRKMQLLGFDPDLTTMLGVLPACSHLAALQHGFCSHGYLIVRGFATDTQICNALIDMYSKCGKISFAREVFDGMERRDIVSWNAMIIGYGIHGLGLEALALFHDLLALGLKPDDITFICLLSACSHSGLVMEGKLWFDAMGRDFSIVPRMEHCICMVDILGRAGLVEEAHHFIRNMPFAPDVRVWSALLSACRIHKNIELGEEVSKKIQSLGPESTGNFVLLSNIYSAAGRWDDAAHIRITQKAWGLRKIPGCSWIEINGIVHAFVGGDQSHLQLPQISRKLEELLVEMKRLGYGAECSYVFQDVEEEEKEQILLYHSEKLAIAFGILNLKAGKPIIVTKNLRVCGDCHAAIKFITVITKTEIIVRDANRFHHFKNGTCNCGDFW